MNNKFAEIQALKQEILEATHCALPGKVVSYDSTTQTASVRLTVLSRSGRALPVLQGVPVFMPLAFAVSEGDVALVVFADKDIDAWLETGEDSAPLSDRKHSLSDGFAFVGFLSGGGQIPGQEGTVDLRDYYTKEEVNSLLQGVESDISEDAQAAAASASAAAGSAGAAASAQSAAAGSAATANQDAQAAAVSESASEESAETAKKWAIGKLLNGDDVPSTDPAYNNHAQYWANNASFLRAQFAVMIGDLQGEVSDLIAEAQEQQAEAGEAAEDLIELYQNLIDAGMKKLNGVNFLKQNFWTSRLMPSSAVIVETLTVPVEDATAAAQALTFTITNEAITTNYKLHGVQSSNYDVVSYASVTGAFSAGQAVITIAARSGAHNAAITVKVALCTQSNQNVPYGNASRISGSTYPYLRSIYSGWYPGDDTTDNVYVSVVDLAGANIVTDLDEEVYNKALQYNITANSAYGNAEWLLYFNPYSPRTYYSDVTPAAQVRNYGQIEQMEKGETYTVSFWARVISGEGAWARMGFGNSYTNAPYNDTTNHRSGVSDWIVISGAAWKRYEWTFEFNPTGDWYTETSEQVTVEGVTHTKVTRSYNWYKKVCFGVGRKFTSVVQFCGFRLMKDPMWVPDISLLYDSYVALDARVTALEQAIINAQ